MATFSSKAEVTEFLERNGFDQTSAGAYYPSGTYYLSHGEYSQPEFFPRRYKDGWGVHGVYFYYSGTFNAPKDGRVSEEFFRDMA